MQHDNQSSEKPYLADVYPDRAQYRPGETVRILAEICNPGKAARQISLQLLVFKQERIVYQYEKRIGLYGIESSIEEFTFSLLDEKRQGFGVKICLHTDSGAAQAMSTAFDIAEKWSDAPRYGFLADFYKEDEEDTQDVAQMAKYHLNVVQFYDWMYRHEDLLPKEEYFSDALGRKLSAKAIRNKIRDCHEKGMTVLAYGAIYGAGKEFARRHADWVFYNNAGRMQGFENWINIMDIEPESPWCGHIIGEYEKAIREFGFDGIHMDTYGFPKTAFSRLGGPEKLVSVKKCFPPLIRNTREKLRPARADVGLIFNAVSNWGVEEVAPSEVDAVYIEVWAPFDRYFHLYGLIEKAKRLGGGKQVILAAYYKPFSEGGHTRVEYAENSFRLTSAVIFASGGYQILLGEKNGILTEGYYVRYATLRPEFCRTVRDYYDFIVRYADLLYDPDFTDNTMTCANGINTEFVFENGRFSSYGEPDKVWTILKEKPGHKTINLINLTGIGSDIWNEEKSRRPETLRGIRVRALIDERVKSITVASPDFDACEMQKLDLSLESGGTRGNYVVFDIPELEVWDLIDIEVEP